MARMQAVLKSLCAACFCLSLLGLAAGPLRAASMDIKYDNRSGIFHLRTDNMSYAMNATSLGYLKHLYWGPVIDRDQDLQHAAVLPPLGDRNRPAAPDKTLPDYIQKQRLIRQERFNEEYAAWSGYFYDEPCIKATFADGVRDVVLNYVSHEITSGPESRTLRIRMKDAHYPLIVDLFYRIYAGLDVVDRWVSATNTGKEPIALEDLQSAVWLVPQGKQYRLTHLSGKWSGEHQMERVMLTQSKVTIETRTGVSNHLATPWFALDYLGQATEDTGRVWYGSLHWSGSWKIVAEVNQHDQTRVTGGTNDFDSVWNLKPGETFTAPKFTGGFTASGFGAAARQLHDYMRTHVLPKPHVAELPPVMYNSWSVFRFNIDVAQQMNLVDTAADVGCEVYMVDDGWFSTRDNETSGLGDWWPSKAKFPNGLKPLIDKVKSRGMQFGLWVEPEMVNEKSELFSKHPEWVIQFPNRERTRGRAQLVLNFGRKDVQDWCVDWMHRLLAENDIPWIKWDMNRYIADPGWMEKPREEQREIWIRFVQGLYDVFRRLRELHPNVKYINCASGGGRTDMGLFAYTDRLTLTDNGDPLDFLRLYWGYLQVFPARLASTGFSNDLPNGINGRTTPLPYRAMRGYFGAMGVGTNFKIVDQNEIAYTAETIKRYKGMRHLVAFGDTYRLASPYENPYMAIEYAAKDGSEAAVLLMSHSMQYYRTLPKLRLHGLKSDALYDVEGLGVASGAWLESEGIPIRFDADFDGKMIMVKRTGAVATR
jgi:alpha-galactosidase